MKEAIGSYWLTIIVITFIVLFSGYLCLSINVNKAYKVKNEIINIIQKNNGLDANALDQIQAYMTSVGYRTTGKCGINDYGYSINSSSTTTNKTVFCVKPQTVEYTPDAKYSGPQFPKVTYYQVKVFFAVDLPLVRDLFTFTLKGSTKKLFYPCEETGGCVYP